MPPARVVAVAPKSPAAIAGLIAGDELLSVNGEPVRDVIRYHLGADEPRVALEVLRGGSQRAVVVEKAAGAPLGLELSSAVFDRVRTCDNHCPFCFIYQLPKGMRRSLYVKDDDYRLSFLYGNFTTLTRFTEADLERVVTERLGPLYVSIHATDPDLRARLLRNRRGATSLRWLAALLAAGIEVHGQVVVCPGVNDGPALDDTLLGVLDRYPELASIGLVPLGVSAHTTEPELRVHGDGEAAAVLDAVDRWQARFLEVLGRRMVFAADEYYLMADRAFPDERAYEGFPQLENGIGMATTFAADVARALRGDRTPRATASGRTADGGFFAWVDGAPASGYRAQRSPVELTSTQQAGSAIGSASGYRAQRSPVELTSTQQAGSAIGSATGSARRPTAILTGAYGASVLEPLRRTLEDAAGTSLRLVTVPNHFFGGNIGVTGLLTAEDLDAVLEHAPRDHRYLLPDVVLSEGRFLDGRSVDSLARPVEVVPTDGASLVAALMR